MRAFVEAHLGFLSWPNPLQLAPLTYLAIYLACVPGFGIIYTIVVPHDFYSPYARYEPDARRDADLLARTLTNALRASGSTNDDAWIIDDFIVERHTLEVFAVSPIDEQSILLTIGGRVTEANGIRRRAFSGMILRVALGIQYYREYSDLEKPRKFPVWLFEDVMKLLFSAPSNFSERVFAAAFEKDEENGRAMLALKPAEAQAVFRYLDGIGGDTSGISGEILRMTYLSAVVITTLGLGDIVPISPLARLLIAVEAILGVTIAGLFLNSVASRATKVQ